MSKPAPATAAGPRARGSPKGRARPRRQVAHARLEAEARQAAASASAGRGVDSAKLSAAAPARSLGGAGAPLPVAIRARLERLFAADLAAVRVHQGPAAQAAAAGARARAAGTHVYLGSGESVEAASSFPVLVHELAHVLQQTGEPTEDGRLAARERWGTAAPLAWEAPFGPPPAGLTIDKLLAYWLVSAQQRGDSEAEALIGALQAAHEAAPDHAGFWAARAAAVISDTPDPIFGRNGGAPPTLAELPELARAALFDGLKRHGEIVAAAKLLQAHDQTESVYPDPDTYLAYVALVGETHLLARILELWEELPIFGEARPKKMMALSASWLLGAFNDVPKLPILDHAVPAQRMFLDRDLHSWVAAAIRDMRYAPNELAAATLVTVAQLDHYRRGWLALPEDGRRIPLTRDDRIDARIAVARELELRAASTAQNAAAIRAGTQPSFDGALETRHLLVSHLAPALGALGSFALDFWRLGDLAENAVRGAGTDAAAERGLSAESMRAIGGTPEPFPGLQAALVGHAETFFARSSAGALPTPSEYRANANAARDMLRRLTRVDLPAAVIQLINRAWNVDERLGFDASRIPEDRTVRLAQAAWLMGALTRYATSVDSYVQADDEAYQARWGGRGLLSTTGGTFLADDVRVMHRGRTARALLALAERMGLAPAVVELTPIVNATEIWDQGAQEQHVLAIAEPFRPRPSTSIARLSADMDGARVFGWEEFSIQQLVLFFQGDHYRRIARTIGTLLGGAEGARFDVDQVPILNQATTTEHESIARPLRYTVEPSGFIYLYRPLRDPSVAADPTAPAEPSRIPLRTLLPEHPMVRELTASWPVALVPAAQVRPDLVLWRLPEPEGLSRFLQRIPAVVALIAEFAVVSPRPGLPIPSAGDFALMGAGEFWRWWVHLTLNGDQIDRRRALGLKSIPEVNQKLAEYARADVPPNMPSEPADAFANMLEEPWWGWFERLIKVSDPAVERQRALSFRPIAAVNDALAAYSASSSDPLSSSDLRHLSDSDWFNAWRRLINVAVSRRVQLRDALGRSDLTAQLSTERTSAWDAYKLREREALVHERERIVRTQVEPLLRAYSASAHIGDFATIHGRQVSQRDAARQAIEVLDTQFLFQILDDDEREAHKTAALLRVAFVLRDALVVYSDSKWIMSGWDKNAAWWWLPIVEDAIERADAPTAGDAARPPLDAWLRADERPATSFVAARRPALENVRDGLFEALKANQRQTGIVAVAGDGTIENPGHVHDQDFAGQRFGAGKTFVIDGISWEVVQVEESFTYHPAGIRRDGHKVMPSILIIDGTELVEQYDDRPLMRVEMDGELKDVRYDAEGDEILRRFAYAVIMAGTVEQLQALGQLMEEGTMFVIGLAIDFAELFPVAGQAAAAARIVLGVGSLLADAEFRELMGALIEDPSAIVDSAIEMLSSTLSVQSLAEGLLFNPALEGLENLRQAGPAQPRRLRNPGGVGRILRRLAAIGAGVAGAFARVLGLAHDVRDDIQSVVLEHALLGRALFFIADHLHFLEGLQDVPGLEDLSGRVTGAVRARFVSLTETVGELRLPEKLVEMDDVVSIFLNLLGRRLGGKYRLGYEVIKYVLEAVGRWDEVVGLISRGIIRVLGDPTTRLNAWKVFVDDEIAPHVEELQAEVHRVLSTIYGAIPGTTDELPAPAPLNLQFEGDQFLDAAPLLRPSALRAPLREGVRLDGGRDLSEAERATFETQFGQDLSHVRLHTGTDAARATRAVGARALTTGSHILLAPDVRPEAESGRSVMRHELVHVLQQTGPRPLGESDARPDVGEPGLGVRIDPQAEALAEEISRGGQSAQVGRASGGGLQPAMVGLGQSFIDYLIHIDRARGEAERIESTGARNPLIGTEVRDDVAAVDDALGTWIDTFGRAHIQTSVQGTFGSVVGPLKSWLESRKEALKQAVNDLAVDASDPVGRRGDARESHVMELREEAFERKLQRFIAAATGCHLDIELERQANGRLNRRRPMRSAKLINLNLALVPHSGAGQQLWEQMMSNTFSSARRSDAHLRAQIRTLLFAIGLGDRTWHPSAFKLDDDLKRMAERETNLFRSEPLPIASTFWHAGDNPPVSGQEPAMFIGRHGDARHHGYPGRQSHHTTQYLLVQYFEQHHPHHKPFPNMTIPDVASIFRDDLGFQLASRGGYVNAVGEIAVGTLDVGSSRGAGMPAMMMASVTHRRGNLHVRAPEVRDAEEDDSVTTPATALQSWFRSALEETLGAGVAQRYWDIRTLLQSVPGSTPSADVTDALDWLRANATAANAGANLRAALPTAMKAVYRHMRERMLDPIHPALRTLEKVWYEQQAIARGEDPANASSEYHVSADQVLAIATRARNNNEAIMEDDSRWA